MCIKISRHETNLSVFNGAVKVHSHTIEQGVAVLLVWPMSAAAQGKLHLWQIQTFEAALL